MFQERLLRRQNSTSEGFICATASAPALYDRLLQKNRISPLSFSLPDLDPICSPWVTSKSTGLSSQYCGYTKDSVYCSPNYPCQHRTTALKLLSEWCLGVNSTALHYCLTCQYHQQKMHEHAFGIQGHAVGVIQVALMDVLSKLRKRVLICVGPGDLYLFMYF